uniref:alpha-glucosidase n=1 Tax=Riptortus pedestris TaxID=329032 RepID=R4WCR1_RIPPE|nr:alpha-amylase [Riptortus pedestris]
MVILETECQISAAMMLPAVLVFLLATSALGIPDWWKTSVLYQIYPRSYSDSDGDGNGDIRGIINHLPYIKSLGVGVVWLSPIYSSPWQDMGYDISNFKDVHPKYGTLDDVKELIDKSHQQGMKVFMDFVPNHSSDQHPWFNASRYSVGDAKDYYVWVNPKGYLGGKPIPPNNWLSNFGGSAWEYDEVRKQYYLHEFGPYQPDLNYRNPKLVEQMKDVLRFWFNLGIDGFRCDTVPHLVEDSSFKDEPFLPGCTDPNNRGCLDHIYTENQPETYDVLKQFDEMIQKEYNSTRYLVLEVYASLDKVIKYYQQQSSPFNFFLITDFKRDSTAVELAKVVHDYLQSIPSGMWPNWVVGNHDQSRVGTRMGEDLIDSMNMLILLLPGTAVTFQGEEIGMTDAYIRKDQVLDSVGRDPQRSPVQWDSTKNGGFSTGDKTWLPLNSNYWRVNVKAETAKPKSHLSVYKKTLELRRNLKNPTDFKVNTYGKWVAYFKRDSETESYFYVINLNDREEMIPTSVIGASPTVYIASENAGYSEGNKISEYLVLPPRSSVVLLAPNKMLNKLLRSA